MLSSVEEWLLEDTAFIKRSRWIIALNSSFKKKKKKDYYVSITITVWQQVCFENLLVILNLPKVDVEQSVTLLRVSSSILTIYILFIVLIRI